MQAITLLYQYEEELDKLTPNLCQIKHVSFKHVNQILQEIGENISILNAKIADYYMCFRHFGYSDFICCHLLLEI